MRAGAAGDCRAAHRARAHRLVRPARRAARQDADGARGGRRAARWAGPGQHPDAEGHLRPHGVQGVRAWARPTNCRASVQANNLLLLPDPASFRAAAVGAIAPAGCRRSRGSPMASRCSSTRAACCRRALGRLSDAGFGLRCGLEVEFHIYRIDDERLDPDRAAWPGEPPRVSMIHPGYNLLAEGWSDMADEALQIVQRTAQGLGLPLRSLEIELGPEPGRGGVRRHRRADRGRPHGAVSQWRAPGAAPPRLPRQLRVHAAVRQRDGQRLAPAPVAGGSRHGRQRDAPRCAGSRCARRRCGVHAVGGRRAVPGGAAGARSRHGGAVHAHHQRLRPLSARTRWRRSRCCGAATTAARCCACSGAAATPPRASKTASASRAPTRTSTSPRRSTPGSTASGAA